MLHVQQFLHSGKTFQDLNTELGIVVKDYSNDKDNPCPLVVLNYDQIDSPKSHPIVIECRGLILHRDTFEVVSRSFDRFFNYGECNSSDNIDPVRSYALEKVDGSLIKVYHFNNWQVSTRGTAFAESNVNTFDCTFDDLFHSAISRANNRTEGTMTPYINVYADPEYTYIFELACRENRVVTRYEKDQLVLLGIRHNKTGEYKTLEQMKEFVAILQREGANVRMPKIYHISSFSECEQLAQEAEGLDEGYVIWDPVTQGRLKIKSPKYLAAHTTRNNGVITPDVICRLVLLNEHEEYLAYFEEDLKYFEPYIKAHETFLNEMATTYELHQGLESQKDFALKIKDLPYSDVLFRTRAAKSSTGEVFKTLPENKRISLLQYYTKFKGLV